MLKKTVSLLLKYLFYFFEMIFPKKRNLIVFSQSGERFNDNSKALFEYMITKTNFEVVWLYHKSKPLDTNNFIKIHSLKGLLYALRANVFIISHGLGDLGLYRKSNKKIIQLWHGIAIKNLGMLDLKLQSSSIDKMLVRETNKYNMFIASSDIDSFFLASVMGIDVRKVKITGLPRNDFLTNFDYSKSNIKANTSISNVISNKKVILYAPTFRDFGDTIFFPFDDFSSEGLSNYLEKNNAVLLIRPHPNDYKNKQKIQSEFKNCTSVNLISNDELNDVNDLMPYVDVIVTDYSSIYIDLLLRDVTPVFIPYDLENYKNVRGLAYDYNLVTPGPKVSSQNEFLNAITDALAGALSYRDKREFVKKMFHKYEDGDACKRVVETMEKLV